MPESDWKREELMVLQTDLDDESPQVLGALLPRLLDAGALDAHLQPLLMKKNRPGVRIEVLCREEERPALLRMIFRETGTLGVKARPVERYALARRTETVEVAGTRIRVKLALLDGEVLRAVPEFEDCRAVAEGEGRPLREIMELARLEARRFLTGPGDGTG